MKIGILTFHYARNYGAVLQCYALQETLKSMGHEVEVIDYRPNYLLNYYKILDIDIQRFFTKNPKQSLKIILSELLISFKKLIQSNKFQYFINKKLNISTPGNSHQIPNKYDAYIIGSDQLWNLEITDNIFDPVYLADFHFTKENKKYITYAVSMGAIRFPNKNTEEYFIKNLHKFDTISVRENYLAHYLQSKITSCNIELTLDPTLLLQQNIWTKLAIKPNISKKYIVVYNVRQNNHTLRIANIIAKQINAEIIQLATWSQLRNSTKKMRLNTSPEEFLGWIKHAKCILTTSFHGTVFATIFNRPFYCIRLNDNSDERSESLLKLLKLDNRMIEMSDTPLFETIDYTQANAILNNKRKQSYHFLTKSLQS